jgi:hypothetical protein
LLVLLPDECHSLNKHTLNESDTTQRLVYTYSSQLIEFDDITKSKSKKTNVTFEDDRRDRDDVRKPSISDLPISDPFAILTCILSGGEGLSELALAQPYRLGRLEVSVSFLFESDDEVRIYEVPAAVGFFNTSAHIGACICSDADDLQGV